MASLVGIASWPFTSRLAASLAAILLLPLAIGFSLLWSVVYALVVGRVQDGAWFGKWLPSLSAASLVLLIGTYASNVLFIDTALQARTLVGYVVTAALAGLVILVLRAWGRGRAGPTLRGVRLRRVSALLAAAVGLALVIVDSTFLTESYWSFHVGLLPAMVGAFTIAAGLGLLERRLVPVAVMAMLGLLAPGAWRLGSGVPQGVYDQMASIPTLQQRALLLGRRLLDRDGDGYSAALGGGDCDDRDPAAFPLATGGRDCLGWSAGVVPLPTRGLPEPLLEAGARVPRMIVLVTVDALRCAETAPERHLLDGVCANITRLGKQGRLRMDGHTTYPSTGVAIQSLHSGEVFPRDGAAHELLAAWMGRQGRSTHAISTHRNQMPAPVARSFQTVDREPQALAAQGTASSAAVVTDRALAKLREYAPSAKPPLFMWLHYYDPHAPYVDPPGSAWALEDAEVRYAAEVRRVDAELGRLAEGISALGSDALLFVTADHGEELDEKGASHHGSTLNEAAIRIPMLAWSPDRALLNDSSDMPASLAEVAGYLAASALGQPFVSDDRAFSWVLSHGKREVGIYRDGFKLTYDQGLNVMALYDVRHDLGELRDLVTQRPELVQSLGEQLASFEAAAAGRAARTFSE